jgi:hypothetical protein
VFASIFEKNTSMVSKGNNSLNLFFPKRPEGPALIKAKIDWGYQFYKFACLTHERELQPLSKPPCKQNIHPDEATKAYLDDQKPKQK